MFKYFAAFRAVYENRNFSLAAKQIFTSQSSISQQIKKLEQLLGHQLFMRNSRSKIIPTGIADELYNNGIQLFEQQQALQRQLMERPNRKLTCRIGISHTISDIIGQRLIEFITSNDDTNFSFVVENSSWIAEQMENHQLTFGLIEKAIITPQINRTPFHTDCLVHAGNLDSDLWIERESGSGTGYYTEEFFKQNNVKPKQLIRVNNNDLIIRCIAAGIGQTIISRDVLPSNVPFKELDQNFTRRFFLLSRHSYPFPEYIRLQKQLTEFVMSVE